MIKLIMRKERMR